MSNTSHTTLPEPRRAVTELPDQAAVDAAGIHLDLETARLVSCVMFRQATRGRSKSRMTIYNTILGLVFMAHEALDRNGHHEPAPFPDLRLDRWPQGKEVFKKLGITHRDLEIYGIKARQHADDACLPLAWALALYPPEIWPMIATVILWGPEQTGLRMQWAVSTMATIPTKRQRRRRDAGEPLSVATIENRTNGVWNLMDVLLELRSIATTSPVLGLEPLDAWTTTPRRIDVRALGAKDANQDNTGPSVEVCSARLKELAHAALNTTQRDGYLKRRAALLMAILPLFGGRADAIRSANVDDYEPQHRYRDGTRGPVLCIRPGKTRHHDDLHFLPLPAQLARWLEDWITFTGRHIGQLGEPLFPSRKPKLGKPNTRIGDHGFYTAIAGAHQAGGTGSYALLPMDGDPFIGYRPHAFRHTAYQLITDAATRLQRADVGFFAHVTPIEFAKAMLGHELVTNVSGIYRDLDRDTLTKAVVDEAWAMLWDDGIMRRGADPDRIRAAKQLFDALTVTRDAVQAAARACDARAEQLSGRAKTTGDKQRRLELWFNAASEENAAHRHRDDLRGIEADLADAQAELEAAMSTLVPIPNDVTDQEHDRLVQDALNGDESAAPTGDPGALRDEITLAEVTELWDTSEQTINRWYRCGQPANKPMRWIGGRSAWNVYSQKHKRLRVDAINTATLTPYQQERLLQIRRRRTHLDAEVFHPGADVPSKHEPVHEEHTMTNSQTIGRQTADGLVDAWQTSGSSPPNDNESTDDAGDLA